MGLSVANTGVISRDYYTMVYGELTFDSAYATGGETLNASDLGLTFLKGVIVISGTVGWRAVYKRTNDQSGTMQVWATATATTSAGTPVEAAVQDLSTVVVGVLAVGR